MKALLKHILIFILTYVILFIALVSVAAIPKATLKPNFISSASYLCENTTSFRLLSFRRGTVIDRFADSILLSIAYHLDEEQPLTSAMWANYYGGYNNHANKDLLEGIQEDHPAENQYLRYWHGSIIPVRLLHLVMDLKGIYILHALIMAGLLALLLCGLCRRGMKYEAISLIVSFFLIDAWIVPLCLEYTWIFLIMLLASNIVVLKKSYMGNAIQASELLPSHALPNVLHFFLVVGMVTAFLDFLTTETLTLLIPLLLILRIQSDECERIQSDECERIQRYSNSKSLWLLAIKSSITWLIGFCGMWVMKWVTASIVLHQNVMPFVTEHIEERMSGNVAGLSTGNYIIEAILRNIRELPFFEFGIYGAVALCLVLFLAVFLPVYQNKIMLRRHIRWGIVALYAVLALIPYIRYAVLHNHSYLHSFTYRAQASTLFAIFLIVCELVERKKVTNHTEPVPVYLSNHTEPVSVKISPEEEKRDTVYTSSIPSKSCPSLTILMPCYNEESTIAFCIREAQGYLETAGISGEILIVDNSSTDNSAHIASSMGARVVTETIRGYGAALRRGIHEAQGHVIIMGDADTTYDFRKLDGIYEPLKGGEADVIIGRRILDPGAMSLNHVIGVKILSALARMRYHTDVQDFHCGLRGITKAAAGRCVWRCTGMEFATEMIAEAARKGLRIGQVDVPLRRCQDEKRKAKLRTVRDGFRHLWVIIGRG